MLRVLPIAACLLALTIYAAGRLHPDRGVAGQRNLPKLALAAADPALPVGRADRLVHRRPARAAPRPTVGARTGRSPAPRGPDDDPDFLRNL